MDFIKWTTLTLSLHGLYSQYIFPFASCASLPLCMRVPRMLRGQWEKYLVWTPAFVMKRAALWPRFSIIDVQIFKYRAKMFNRRVTLIQETCQAV